MVTVNASRETAVETVRTTQLVRKMLLDKIYLLPFFLMMSSNHNPLVGVEFKALLTAHGF